MFSCVRRWIRPQSHTTQTLHRKKIHSIPPNNTTYISNHLKYVSQATTHQQTRSHQTHHIVGTYTDRPTGHIQNWSKRDFNERGFTVGIGGPVGSGKTALTLRLCLELRDVLPLGVVTNDIFTQEDAEFLIRKEALPKSRIVPVETGGCPHAAIREDVTANLGALERLTRSIQTSREHQKIQSPPRVLLLCESGGDNLAANFSNELADCTIYVIDVAGGDKIPRKGGPGITQSDILVINKIDLADDVGSDLEVMKRDAILMRGGDGHDGLEYGPIVMSSMKLGDGVEEIKNRILSMFTEATSKEESTL